MLLIGIVIVFLVSRQLSVSIDKQSKFLADSVRRNTAGELQGRLSLLIEHLEHVQGELDRGAVAIAKNPSTVEYLERNRVKQLQAMLEQSCRLYKMEFAVIYDREGVFRESYPRNVNVKKLDSFADRIKLTESTANLKSDAAPVNYKVGLNSNELRGFGLESLDIEGKGGIALLSAAPVFDDFGEFMGTCLSGLLLNHYHEPCIHLYELFQSPAAVYMDNIPISHGGFEMKNDSDMKKLRIDKETLSSLYKTDRREIINIILAGQKYFSMCAPLKSYNGENIGVFLAGVPEKEVRRMERALSQSAVETRTKVQYWLTGIVTASLFCLAAIAFYISVILSKRIDRTAQGISSVSAMIDKACDRVLAASAEVFDGASNQVEAASLSAESIQDVANMAENSMENTLQANGYMEVTSKIADESSKSLKQLTEAIHEISESGNEITTVVKTIDEIAFQTNLLALNASVEAARAGEAGAGFAVVAGEVRNLALRSAAAAKNTGEMIASSVNKITQSTHIAAEVGGSFEKLAGGAEKTRVLLNDIAGASRSQNQHINQVQEQLVEMQAITRQTAGNAEVCKTSAREVNELSERLNYYANDLTALTGHQGQARFKNTLPEKNHGNYKSSF